MARHRGVPFEEAVVKWIGADAVREVHAHIESVANGRPSPQELNRAFRRVDRALIEKLYAFELFASGTSNGDDNRFILKPETLDPRRFRFDRTRRILTDDGIKRFESVEVFELDDIPLNIFTRPNWFRLLLERQKQDRERKEPSRNALSSTKFRHGPDFRHVELNGKEYSLTPMQARIVKILYDARLANDDPWLHIEKIRELAGFESQKLAHLFRRMKDWRELIESDSRGHYRLNL